MYKDINIMVTGGFYTCVPKSFMISSFYVAVLSTLQGCDLLISIAN